MTAPDTSVRQAGDRQAPAPQILIRHMIFGRLLSQAVCAAAELGLPELLAGGRRTAAQLAAACGAEPQRLRRLLRALAAHGVFAAHPDGTFGPTPLSDALRADAHGSALPTALLAREAVGAAWDGLLGTVRGGRPAFDAVHGRPFFDSLADEPHLRELFDRSQAHDLELEIDQILAAIDLSGRRVLVDVGGGDGAMLVRLLSAAPSARGVLLDTAEAAERARPRIAAAGLDGRCSVVAGDFFASVPAGGDLYLLRQILHDWDDARCVELLRVCRAAMGPHARLMIIEREAGPSGPADSNTRFAALMDLYMMSVLDGAERSVQEFQALLDQAGFTVAAVHRLECAVIVIEAAPVETPGAAGAEAKTPFVRRGN
ncbi:methyltransferase [Actinomadura rubrobrunea]|uniref:Methyltransferase n=1 Tax=Actinomadura rubrobrunea TaxID=115335 RepID=A0A9W6PYQ7_9ACTN|nr:methyltransferase [Actinomadura rubrobrunea]GLW65157.1 methyltransferase [Actinomadura rubrobrunea]